MFKWGAISVALTMLAATANAGMVVDVIDQHIHVDRWGSGNASYSYTHDFTDNAAENFFDPNTEQAVSGTLEVEINAGNSGWQAALFVVEAFDFDTGGVTFGIESWGWDADFAANLGVNALGSINDDGRLDVSVYSLFWTDFYVGDSTLTIYTQSNPGSSFVVSRVPEPSILALLGIGLVGLRFARPAKSA